MRRFSWLLTLLLSLSFGCSRCGSKPTTGPSAELTGLLARNAEGVLIVPALGSLGERLAILEELKIVTFAAQLQGFRDGKEYFSALAGQLGVDLRSPQALKEGGVDPARGLAVVVLEGGQAYSVVGVSDEGKFASLVSRIAENRLGAGKASKKEQDGVALRLYSESAGGDPVLGYAMTGGYAVVAAGSAVAQLSRFARLPVEQSLARDEAFAAVTKRLPAPHDAVGYLPAGSSWAKRSQAGGSGVAVRLTPEALSFFSDIPWTGDAAGLAALVPQKGPGLLDQLPADAFLVLRFAGDWASLAPRWSQLAGPYLENAFKEANLDAKSELFDNLVPGSALSVSLAPDVRLGAGVPQLDIRRTNPLTYIHVAGIAKVKDAAKATLTLEKLPALGPKLGAKIEPAERMGKKAYLTTYSQGQGAHFAMVGDALLMGAPASRLDAMIERAGGGGTSGDAKLGEAKFGALVDPSMRKRFEGQAFSLVLDLRRLAQSVRELPTDAWGVGGFAIKATALRWMDALAELRAISWSASARDNAIQSELSLLLEKAPK
jgi:hypothetical protein